MKAPGTKRLKLKCDEPRSNFAFELNLRRFNLESNSIEELDGLLHLEHLRCLYIGKAVQVVPIKPTLKAPGTKRLKLKCDRLLSTLAFKFNLRRYNVEALFQLANVYDMMGNYKVRRCRLTLSNPR